MAGKDIFTLDKAGMVKDSASHLLAGVLISERNINLETLAKVILFSGTRRSHGTSTITICVRL